MCVTLSPKYSFQGDNVNVCGVAIIISATTLTGYFNAIPIEETMWLSNIFTVSIAEKCWLHGFWKEKYVSIGLTRKKVWYVNYILTEFKCHSQ